ncbi:MAG TPA: DUF2231 domain-containing protein [Steroidobacteraceae bacterium]|nr:DUF2231 domain-containing protein [Steroidobacteraceae bacterium]
MKLTLHPLHPALAHFPVAFWSAAVAADAAALVTDDGAWWTWSHHALVAGLLMAALALLAGAGEAFYRRIPRQATRTLIFHITSMLTAFALFLASLALRKQSPPSTVAIALSALGLAALLLGGWFGGSLVYRFGVGTQHAPPDSPRI